jgi:hypothetical protein
MNNLTQTLLAAAVAAAHGGVFAQANADQVSTQKPGECPAGVPRPWV